MCKRYYYENLLNWAPNIITFDTIYIIQFYVGVLLCLYSLIFNQTDVCLQTLCTLICSIAKLVFFSWMYCCQMLWINIPIIQLLVMYMQGEHARTHVHVTGHQSKLTEIVVGYGVGCPCAVGFMYTPGFWLYTVLVDGEVESLPLHVGYSKKLQMHRVAERTVQKLRRLWKNLR